MTSWLKRIWLTPPSGHAPEALAPRDPVQVVAPDEVWKVLDNVNEWVKHAETKLGVVQAFLGVLAAGLVALAIEVGPPSTTMLWIQGSAGFSLLLAAGAATLGLLPQFAYEPEETKANPIYYGDINRYFRDRQDYADHLKTSLTDNDRVVSDLAQQIVANSRVAVRKYTWANRAIFLGFVSVLGIVAVVVGLVLGW